MDAHSGEIAVAIVWRGDENAPDARQPETGRLNAIFSALIRSGMRPVPAPYDERHADAFARRLRETDAVLVWVNPIDAGRNRKALRYSARGRVGRIVRQRPSRRDRKDGGEGGSASNAHARVGKRYPLL